MRKHSLHKPLIAFLLFLVTAGNITGCATNPVSGTPNVVFMSEPSEINIGETNDPNIRKKYGVYNNTELQTYVDRPDPGETLPIHCCC